MSDQAQREMSLEEVLERLNPSHRARREYFAICENSGIHQLRAEVLQKSEDALRAEVARLEGERDKAKKIISSACRGTLIHAYAQAEAAEQENDRLTQRVETLESDSTKKFNMLMERGTELQKLDAETGELRAALKRIDQYFQDTQDGPFEEMPEPNTVHYYYHCCGNQIVDEHQEDCPWMVAQAALNQGGEG